MTERIILYGSLTCPMVPPVRSLLQRASAEFDYVDILFNREARRRVIEINQGNASVPTLVFPDGSILTEPAIGDLETKLRGLGLDIPPATLIERVRIVLQTPTLLTFGMIFLVVGVFGNQPSLTVAGGVLLFLTILGRVI